MTTQHQALELGTSQSATNAGLLHQTFRNRYVIFILISFLAYMAAQQILSPNAKIIAVVILGVILYIRAYYFLLLALALLGILPQALSIGGGTALNSAYISVILILWIVLVEGVFRKFKRGIAPNVCIMIFLILAAANYFRDPILPQIITETSSAYGIKFSYLILPVSLLCTYLVVPYVIKDIRGVNRTIKIIAIFAFAGLFFAYLKLISGVSSPFIVNYAGKVMVSQSSYGSFIRFGWLGFYAFMALPFVLVFIRNSRLKFLMALIILVSIILSGGRAHFISSVSVIAIFFWIRHGKVKTALMISALFAIVVFGSAYLTGYFPQIYRFSDQFIEQNYQKMKYGIPQSRLGIWLISLEMIKDHPLIGAGPATDIDLRGLFKDWDVLHIARKGTHATYFNIAAIYGLPALILYVSGIGIILFNMIKKVRTTTDERVQRCVLWLVLGLTGFFVSNIFSGNARGGNVYFYFVLGLADTVLMCAVLSQKEKEIGAADHLPV